MRVVDVDVAVVRAKTEGNYWGKATWGRDYEVPPQTGPELARSYPIRWRMRHRWVDTVNTCLVRVTTDEGVVGYGESKGVIVPELVKSYIDGYLRDAVIGANPFHTRMVWERMQASMRGRGHVQGFHQEAAAGIDIALWDIAGKVAGRPICDLLGGRYRDSVRVYYSGVAGIERAGDAEQEERLGTDTRVAVAKGFTGVKIGIGFGRDADLRSADVVREVGGPELLVLVDALGSYGYTDALYLSHALAERGVGWFEAPLTTDDLAGYVRLSQEARLPIANDLIWTRTILKGMLAQDCRMVVQPEVIKVGITECAAIAELADVYGCAYAPHVSIGSAIEFAASAHIAAAAPNFLISEYWAGENPLGDGILREPMGFADSALVVPDEPGLGIELDLERLRPHIDVGWETVTAI